MNNAAPHAGFTLLEVLIALAIFATAAAALLQLFSSELDRAAQTERQRAAVALAQSKLDAAVLGGPVGEPQRSTGTDHGLAWQVTVARHRERGLSDTSLVMPVTVSATVRWDAERAVTLTTMRLVPRP